MMQVTLSLREARMLQALLAPTTGNTGYDLYKQLADRLRDMGIGDDKMEEDMAALWQDVDVSLNTDNVKE